MVWTINDMPRLEDRLVLVTGGASGIGFQVARELGARAAEVVILGRDRARGEQAVAQLRDAGGRYSFELVDLAALDSIAAFTSRWCSRPIDMLLNVAGVMAVPEKTRTHDGFEMHMGTNFLGHYALTGNLIAALRQGRARVVTVSAQIGRMKLAKLDPEDIDGEQQRYSPMTAYARSKLADIMFAVELQRREAAAGITSIAVDPGTAVTNLQRHSKGVNGTVGNWLSHGIGYPLARVAENVLFASVMPEVNDQMLIGPSCFVQRFASPKDVGLPVLARDSVVRDALWSRAAALTGVAYGH